MAAVRPLGEYVQTSSELTDLACNAINVLFSNIRTCPDQVAACATSSGVSTFDSFDTTNTDPMAGTIIQWKSALRLPGPQKRTRIVGQGERFKKTTTSTNKMTHFRCKICSGNTCTTRFCRTLANFGQIVKPHREHKYEQVLSIDTSLVSTIEECDFSIDPFDVSWDFVLLEALYKDDRGQKYVKIEALTCKLELFQPKQLYTFSALKQCLDIKPKRKELLLKSGVSWNSIGVERFVRPRVLIRFSAAVLAQV